MRSIPIFRLFWKNRNFGPLYHPNEKYFGKILWHTLFSKYKEPTHQKLSKSVRCRNELWMFWRGMTREFGDRSSRGKIPYGRAQLRTKERRFLAIQGDKKAALWPWNKTNILGGKLEIFPTPKLNKNYPWLTGLVVKKYDAKKTNHTR